MQNKNSRLIIEKTKQKQDKACLQLKNNIFIA